MCPIDGDITSGEGVVEDWLIVRIREAKKYIESRPVERRGIFSKSRHSIQPVETNVTP